MGYSPDRLRQLIHQSLTLGKVGSCSDLSDLSDEWRAQHELYLWIGRAHTVEQVAITLFPTLNVKGAPIILF